MAVIDQTGRLRETKGFREGIKVKRASTGEEDAPEVPDVIAEAAIGQLRFDVSTNAEGIRRLDEQMTNLNQYAHNELEANSRGLITKEGE
jgi:hypothetical protein